MFSKRVLVFIFVNVLHIRRAFSIPEGAPCMWGEHNGTCLDARRCYSFIYDKDSRNFPPICSFKGKVAVICCTDCPEMLVDDISNALWDSYTGVEWKTGPKSKDACLVYRNQLPYYEKRSLAIHNRYIWIEERQCHIAEYAYVSPSGGEDTRKAEFPYMALLGYGSDLDSAQWLCGGSLISSRFILTAAHCISSPKLGTVKYIALGVWKRSDNTELWQRHHISSIIPHPEYQSPSKYNDIALLETEKRVQFTYGTVPACLHNGGTNQNIPEAIALGWGALGPGKHLADVLQKVKLQNFTDEHCADIYPPNRLLQHGYNSTTQMCYGDSKQIKDTCKGDSGGPLVLHRNASFAQDLIIGVTSFGIECGRSAAGMYTRVDHYLPWIESIVWPWSI